MMQTTIRDLCDQLAAALGLRMRGIDYIAGDLQRAGMIGDMGDLARVEDAARLIVAIGGDLDVRAPRRVVERYWTLPLARVELGEENTDHVELFAMPDDNDFTALVRKGTGDTFCVALSNLIGDHVFLPDSAQRPGNIVFAGAPGHTLAWLRFRPSRKDDPSTVTMAFDQPAFPVETHPHGLPIACPLRKTIIPAAIFDVLREALKDSPHSWANAAEDRADVYLSRQTDGG